MLSSSFKTIRAGQTLLDLSSPKIMGIVNVTPDSFYDGGKYSSRDKALEQATKLLSEGADILDIGAYSSRPNAKYVSEDEELDRLIPFIEQLKEKHPASIISVDTFRAKVAEEAIVKGAHIINDVSGGSLDEEMFATVGRLQVPYILMHMRGTPKTMQSLTDYDDLISDISDYFAERIPKLRSYGVRDIILDPGPGFAKTLEQNYELIRRFKELKSFRLPILGAISRKSMIYNALDISASEALSGTIVLNTVLLLQSASILRVHDVKEAKETIRLIGLLKQQKQLFDL